MKYFRIHICENDGERVDGPDPLFQLCDSAVRFDWPQSLFIKTTIKGKLYDWIGGYSWMPFVKEHIKSRLGPLVGDAVQWHGPFVFRGHQYFLLNCVKVVDCAKDGSNDNKLIIDNDIAVGEVLFRPLGFMRKLICSSELMESCGKNGDSGIRFGRICDDGWEEFPF